MKKTAFALTTILVLLTACGPSPSETPGTPSASPAPQGAPAAGGAGPGGGAPAGGAAGGAAGARTGGRQAVITVQTETVRAGDLMVDNTTAGAVVAETQSSVAAGAAGTVKTILRQVGEWVEPGTPVIQLDDSQLRLSLRLAQATLETAKINAGVSDTGSGGTSKLSLQLSSAQSALASAQKNYASAQALAKVGGISGSDLDNALTALQTAQANLESAKMSVQSNAVAVETATIQVQQAQLNLSNATIKAPYAGQISAINLHPGEYVGTSTAAFSLVSRAKVISFGVSPSDAPGVGLGAPVTFTYNGKTVPTKVTQAPSAPVNGLVPLTADLPPGLSAPLGTVGTLRYRLAVAQGTLVPLPALQSAENKTFVYTVDKGTAQRSEVTVLGESGTYAAVTGLAPGTAVILNAPPGLLIGAKVQVAQGAAPREGTAPATGARPQQPQAKAPVPASDPQLPADQGTKKRQAAPAAGAGEPGTQAPGQGQGTSTGQRRRPAADGTAPAAPAATGGN